MSSCNSAAVLRVLLSRDPSRSVISEDVFWTVDFGMSYVVQRVFQLLTYLHLVPEIPVIGTEYDGPPGVSTE